MKLIFENWRKFINEETVAFHGYKMEPEQMRVPACDSPGSQDEKHGYADKQWTTDDEGRGCPDFSHDKDIGTDHPDIKQAVEYLNNIMDNNDTLIAYSRGGAVALATLAISKHDPFVVFVAPAWKRGWVKGIESPAYSNGVIIHGIDDDRVPLAHSAELSLRTGMPLYAFPGRNHVNILKHKSEPQSGRLLSQEEKEKLVNETNP